jgi:hypothetical protein
MSEPTILPGLLNLDKLSINAQQQNLYNDLVRILNNQTASDAALATHKTSEDHDSRYILASILDQIKQDVYDESWPIGSFRFWPFAALPERGTWLWMDDRTIGDGSSNGTGRANDDCLALFTHLWTNFDNIASPIYTSAGASSTRGASAAEDWTAHKAITLAPLTRGRVFAGMDNPGKGSGSAGTISAAWADFHGRTGGTETHALTSAQNGQHSHTLRDGVGLALYADNTGSGFNSFNANASSDTSGGRIFTDNSGSGTAHPNIQPTTVIRYIIRCA